MIEVPLFDFQKFLLENEDFVKSYRETENEFIVYPTGLDPSIILNLTKSLEIVCATWDIYRQAFIVSKRKIIMLNCILVSNEISEINARLRENSQLRTLFYVSKNGGEFLCVSVGKAISFKPRQYSILQWKELEHAS